MLPLVDIAIALVILIFIIIGLARGFIKSVLALVGTIVSLVAAYFLATPFINFVVNTLHFDIVTLVNTQFDKWISAIPGFSNVINPDTLLDDLVQILSKWLPEAIATPLSSGIFALAKPNLAALAGSKLSTILAPILGKIVLVALSMMVLFILIRLALFIIEKIIDNTILKVRALRSLDRLLGLVLGIVEGAIIVVLIFTIVRFIPLKPDNVVVQAINDSKIGSVVYDSNPLYKWIANLDFNEFIGNIMNPNKANDGDEPTPPPADKDQTKDISANTNIEPIMNTKTSVMNKKMGQVAVLAPKSDGIWRISQNVFDYLGFNL